MIFSQINHLLLAADCTGQSLFPDLFGGGLRNSGTCEVEFTKLSDILILVANIISILMVVAGFVAVAFIIVGGFMYIASSGEPANIKKAKETIVNAVVGLILAMVAFGVVRFVTGSFK